MSLRIDSNLPGAVREHYLKCMWRPFYFSAPNFHDTKITWNINRTQTWQKSHMNEGEYSKHDSIDIMYSFNSI